jgi:hypothetical protein
VSNVAPVGTRDRRPHRSMRHVNGRGQQFTDVRMKEVSLMYEREGEKLLFLFDQPPAFLLDAPLRGLHE